MLKWLGMFLIGALVGYQLAPTGTGKSEHNDESMPSEEFVEIEQTTEIEITKFSPKVPTHSVNSNENLKDKVSNSAGLLELEAKYENLQQDYRKLEEQLSEKTFEVSTLRDELGISSKSEISDEDLSSLVPEAYAQNLAHYHGSVRDAIFEYHQEPEDLGAAFDLSHQITSYITSHPDSYGVNNL